MELEKFYGHDKKITRFDARLTDLEDKFYAGEGCYPDRVFSSPGRAEILGNHTDHNHGKVLVAAISCDILAAVKKRDDGRIKISSDGFAPFELNADDTGAKECERGTSKALTRGVAAAIKSKGFVIGGFTAYLSSDVFRGAGVSSSAAYEVLIAEIFNRLYLDGALNAIDKAVISQYAENVYFGKPCGLLDQSGIALGGLSSLDFRVPTSPGHETLAMPDGYTLVITNTGGDHASLTSHYAAIREEMESVAAYFGKSVLREVDENDFYAHIGSVAEKTSGRAVLRAMHFYDENKRVDKAVAALKNNDTAEFLKAVNESGLSSLIRLQNCAVPGDTSQRVVLGIELSREIISNGAVRVHGGGFAGSILAIVADEEVPSYETKMCEVFGKENVFIASVRSVGTSEML